MTDLRRLRDAVALANLPALLPVLVQLTGDQRWLDAPYRPTPSLGVDDHDDAGLPPEVQAEVRAAAVDAIAAWLEGEPVAIPEPSEALLLRMLSVSMAEDVPSEYGPMLRHVLGLLPEDEVTTAAHEPAEPPAGFRVAIIGAGAAGIAMGHELGRLAVDYTVFEKAPSVGGTWWVNRYPGCGVDAPSHLYSFSFYGHDWPAWFARRDDLHAYFEQASTDLGVRPHVRLSTEVVSARYDADLQGWALQVRGPDGALTAEHADVLVSAVGAFGTPVWPDLPGLDTFEGALAHTARWPEDLDLAGKRVAVVGNGASAMQLVPAIVDEAAHVTVLQRSAQWVMPFAKLKEPVPDLSRWLFQTVPLYRRWYRMRLFWSFNDKLHGTLQRDPAWPHPERSLNATNDFFRDFLGGYAAKQLRGHEELLDHVIPAYPPFGKRILFDHGWFGALVRDDVTLDVSGAAEVRAHSVVSGDGTEHEVDVLVAASGFDVVRFLSSVEITGRSGRTLDQLWDGDDARAHLGTVVPDLPNFFCLYGPNLQPGHGGSFLTTLELQAHYVGRVLEELFRRELGAVEVRQDVHDAYNARVDAAREEMVWTHPGTSSYYRNSRGRVVVNSPWRNVDFWHLTRQPRLEDFEVEPRR